MPTLTTFNANNFFLRYRFARTFPGDMSRKSQIEAAEAGSLGYIPERKFGKALSKDFVVWDPARRELAARALAEPEGRLPDILCLQEVENIDTIRRLNDGYLNNHYKYSFLVDGWDPRNIDVGVLSRFPITNVRSHLDDTDRNGERIFSRDCLEVTFDLPRREELTVFVNHLKSKFVDTRGKTEEAIAKAVKAGNARRAAQARYIAKLVERRFKGRHGEALYAVVGDFNDTEESRALAPLLKSPRLVDALTTTREPDDRWTYYWRSRGRVQQIDYVLVSKALAERTSHTYIERRGLGYRALNSHGEILPVMATLTHVEEAEATTHSTAPSKIPFRFARYESVVDDLAHNVSDHCPVKVFF